MENPLITIIVITNAHIVTTSTAISISISIATVAMHLWIYEYISSNRRYIPMGAR